MYYQGNSTEHHKVIYIYILHAVEIARFFRKRKQETK